MKLQGKPGAATLALSGAAPKTAYRIKFQNISGGRDVVFEIITDANGGSDVPPPPDFGATGYAASCQLLGKDGRTVTFTNEYDDDGTITMTEFVPKIPPSPLQSTPPDKPVN